MTRRVSCPFVPGSRFSSWGENQFSHRLIACWSLEKANLHFDQRVDQRASTTDHVAVLSSCQVAQEDREGTGALNQLGPPLVNNKTRTGFPFLLPTKGRADGPLAWPWTPESPVVSCWSSSYERVQSSQRVRKTGFPSAPRTMNWPFRGGGGGGRSPRGVPAAGNANRPRRR